MTRTPARLVPCLVMVSLAGCGGALGGGGADPGAERDGYDEAAESVMTTEAALRAADAAFALDTTIEAAASADGNAERLRAYVSGELPGGCTVAREGATVTVVFGAQPGCTLGKVAFTGTLVASVMRDASTTMVQLDFVEMTVDGAALSGRVSFATTDGRSFAVSAHITRGGRSFVAELAVVASAGSFTVDGSVSVGEGGASTSVGFDGLHYTRGDCYPDAGTVTIAQGAVAQSITFDAATASSGVVTVTTGRRSSTQTLPAYGACPSSAA